MTAIALLNAETDPHIVADTLLSVDGEDPRKIKKIWLPALGDVQSQWGEGGDRWHISRLARKTFVLPNNSGVLAFAGSCTPAIHFLDNLSEAFRNKYQYDECARVDKELIDRVLKQSSRAGEFWLLGVLIDASDHRMPYTHNSVKRIDTQFFGVCYAAGSGAELVGQLIEREDHRLQGVKTASGAAHWRTTEYLAESISCEMLYRESDYLNGLAVNSPISVGCGGFYEWYKVLPQGIKPMKSRVDIHVSLRDKQKLVITRIYFFEQMQNPKLRLVDSALPSQDYYLSIFNLGLKPCEIPMEMELTEWTTIVPEETVGILVRSFFNNDGIEVGATARQLSASVSPESAKHLFGEPLDVPRVRLIVYSGGVATLSAVTSSAGELPSARVLEVNGRVALALNQTTITALLEAASRLSNINVECVDTDKAAV